MIFKKISFAVVALALLAASAATALFAAAFGIYALLRDVLTPPGAAGAVVGFAALIGVAAALVLARSVGLGGAAPTRRSRGVPSEGLDRLMELARERPIVAAGAGVAVGLLALANPAVVTAAIRAFTESGRGRRD